MMTIVKKVKKKEEGKRRKNNVRLLRYLVG